MLTDLQIVGVDLSVARIAGQLQGELASRSVAVALPDLLITGTALRLNFAVGTSNLRHFRVVPGLRVIEI